jgi:hypothetical protein
MTDQPDERKAVVEQALGYIGSHRPEPPKCEYCGCAQFSLMAGSFAQFCPKAPAGEGHVYMFSVSNEYPETIEAERLADFALMREGELRKRVQEIERERDEYKQLTQNRVDDIQHISKLLLRAALHSLITSKEPNGYPLWFNRAVHDCRDCDPEDLCITHMSIAKRGFTECEEIIAAFEASLLT